MTTRYLEAVIAAHRWSTPGPSTSDTERFEYVVEYMVEAMDDGELEQAGSALQLVLSAISDEIGERGKEKAPDLSGWSKMPTDRIRAALDTRLSFPNLGKYPEGPRP